MTSVKDDLDDLTVVKLRAIVKKKNITLPPKGKGSGKNGNIIKSDLIKAIRESKSVKKPTTDPCENLEKNMDIEYFTGEWKYLAQEDAIRINKLDIKAALYGLFVDEYGTVYNDPSAHYYVDAGYRRIKKRYKKAKKQAEDQYVLETIMYESGEWYRTDKFKAALEKKGLTERDFVPDYEDPGIDVAFGKFNNDFIKEATRWIEPFVNENDQCITYTNLFRYKHMNLFSDYLADKINSGEFKINMKLLHAYRFLLD